jgi:hypothetical protein
MIQINNYHFNYGSFEPDYKSGDWNPHFRRNMFVADNFFIRSLIENTANAKQVT